MDGALVIFDTDERKGFFMGIEIVTKETSYVAIGNVIVEVVKFVKKETGTVCDSKAA